MITKSLAEIQADDSDLFTAEQWAELDRSEHAQFITEPVKPAVADHAPALSSATPISSRDMVAIEYLERMFDDLSARPAPAIVGLPLPLPDYSDPPYEYKTRKDRSGAVWEFLPPDTPVKSGDEVDEGGIWRPKRSLRMYPRRYDRAHFSHREAEAHHAEMLRQHGAESQEAIEAGARLAEALAERQAALRASDDPAIKERDRIDTWRADNPDAYNASRRKTDRGPNADLSGMTEEEKAQHKRAQNAERQRKRRALAGAKSGLQDH